MDGSTTSASVAVGSRPFPLTRHIFMFTSFPSLFILPLHPSRLPTLTLRAAADPTQSCLLCPGHSHSPSWPTMAHLAPTPCITRTPFPLGPHATPGFTSMPSAAAWACSARRSQGHCPLARKSRNPVTYQNLRSWLTPSSPSPPPRLRHDGPSLGPQVLRGGFHPRSHTSPVGVGKDVLTRKALWLTRMGLTTAPPSIIIPTPPPHDSPLWSSDLYRRSTSQGGAQLPKKPRGAGSGRCRRA
jgi:hypothetical protein